MVISDDRTVGILEKVGGVNFYTLAIHLLTLR